MGRRTKKVSQEELEEVHEFMTPKAKKSPLDFQFELKCKTENQKKMVKLFKSSQILIVNGPAGTGKTFLACAEALRMLKNGNFHKIVIVKSVTVLEGEEVGFLKGTLAEKLEPITYSFIANFHKLVGEENTRKLMEAGMIQIVPLAFMRGMSIDNSVILVDEVQNISKANIRTVMTRLGENSKMVLMGDQKQVDLRNKKLSSLDLIVQNFSDKEGFGTVTFQTEDIVRNPLVRLIEETFDAMDGL